MVRRVGVLTMVLASCGPSTATDEGGGSGSAEAGEGGSSSATASTSTGTTSTTTSTTTTATSGTDTTSATSLDGSSSSSETGETGIEGEWEGIYFSGFEYSEFVACGEPSGWWVDGIAGYDGCYGMWMHLTGTLYGPGQYGHLGGWEYQLDVSEVLEVRPCFEVDCGGGPPVCVPEDFFCGGIPGCDVGAQDCTEGEKCDPVAVGFPTWTGANCGPLDPDPLQPGDPCTPAESGEGDPCDVGSTCFAPDGAAQGTCTRLCDPDNGGECPDDCVSCGIPNISLGLCLPECAAMPGCEPGAPCAPPG